MPAPPPAFYPENILEDAILTMTPDGPDALTPIERLVDRDVGLEVQDTGTTGERVWHFDRGVSASTPTVHAWHFAGTGYAGELLTLESSPDNSAWTSRGTVTPTEDVLTRVALTPFTATRYLRVTATSPDVPVNFSEIAVSPQIAFEWKPSAPALREPYVPNVVTVDAQGGQSYGVQRGRARRVFRYLMASSPDVDYTTMLDILTELRDGARPFWLYDVRGVVRFVRLVGGVDFQMVDFSLGQWDIPLDLQDEVP